MSDLREVKEQIEASRLKRRAMIEAVEDVSAAVVTKASGLGMVGVGMLEFVSPEVIVAVLPQPLSVAGAGLALLMGRKAAKVIVDAFGQLLK